MQLKQIERKGIHLFIHVSIISCKSQNFFCQALFFTEYSYSSRNVDTKNGFCHFFQSKIEYFVAFLLNLLRRDFYYKMMAKILMVNALKQLVKIKISIIIFYCIFLFLAKFTYEECGLRILYVKK